MARIGYNLPEEVLVEIFSWLPPQSLIRFKCVSKPWNVLIKTLIKDPDFVNKHLRNIDNKIVSSTTSLVFCCLTSVLRSYSVRRIGKLEQFKLLTVFNDGNNESDHINYVVEVLRLPKTPPSELCPFRSHCNGIICLAYFERVILCNPAINEWRTLPIPWFTGVVKGVGFGYDSRANDYKIVRFGYDGFRSDLIVQAEVYSLRTDSWREIGIHCQVDNTSNVDREFFCKGVFYWFVETHKYIISFDMSDEVFRSIPLPDNLVKGEDHYIKLAVWNDSVALLKCYGERGSTNSIEAWVMRECSGGVEGSCSWTKELDIGPLEDIAIPLTFWKNDELLMQTTDGRSISFNLRSLMLRDLAVIHPANEPPCWWDFPYMKSLVSVQGTSQAHS